MEKRGFLVFLFFVSIALLPAVAAQITLQGPEKTTVNFGDHISVSGSIMQAEDKNGLLKFQIDCGDTTPLSAKSLSLKANTEKTFAETFAIPQSLTGSCAIKSVFEVNGEIVDQATSSSLTITSALNAPIDLDKQSVQLGDTFSLKGTVTKMDGSPIEGVATISLKHENTIILQDTTKITKGKLSYTYKTEDNPSGQYTITIDITDINNNKQIITFDDFTVLGNVDLSIALNSKGFLPGEKVKIDGTAKVAGSRITKGTAYITLDGIREEVTVLLGILKHTIVLPIDIKTGDHTLTITVEDGHGNKEAQQFTITIIAVPTKLETVINQESFMPEEQITLKPTLYDQGNDIIDTDIDLEVYDAEKDLVFTDKVKSTGQTAFTFPRSAEPGLWRIKTTAQGVKVLSSFNVGEFKVLEITQEGVILIFANTGNIPIKEKQTITLTDESNPSNIKTKQKTISLDVEETKTIDLAYYAGKGTYTVQVEEKTFSNVEILKRKWNVMPYLAGILAIIMLYLIIKLIPKGRRNRHHNSSYPHESSNKKEHVQQPTQRQRTQEWYEEKLKKDLAERMEEKRRKEKIHFSFSKRKDEYVAKLQKKKKDASEMPWVRRSSERPIKPSSQEEQVFSNNPSTDFSDPWKSPQESKKEEEEKPKKGMFGLFD